VALTVTVNFVVDDDRARARVTMALDGRDVGTTTGEPASPDAAVFFRALLAVADAADVNIIPRLQDERRAIEKNVRQLEVVRARLQEVLDALPAAAPAATGGPEPDVGPDG
jgi:hypothetical protein